MSLLANGCNLREQCRELRLLQKAGCVLISSGKGVACDSGITDLADRASGGVVGTWNDGLCSNVG